MPAVSASAVAWVGLAGGVGAATRFVVDGTVSARTSGLAARLQIATLWINVSGSLLLGVLTGLVVFHGMPATVALVAGSGFCGGFTTFSTASFETVRLIQTRDLRAAGLQLGLMVGGTLVAAGTGVALASL